jgi:uncharacterized protein (TIGR03067 family)
MRSRIWILGLTLLLGAAEPRKDDVKNDGEPLQGGWTMFLVFRNGEEAPPDLAKTGELIIEDQEYRAKMGVNSLTATFTVDSSKEPKEIDFTPTAGENKGKTVKGIYKIAGDYLTICRGLTEKEARPTDFAAPVNSGLLLVTWKRSKTFVSTKAKAMENKDRVIADELKRFEATWRFVEIEVGGQKVPEKAFAKDTLILKGKTFASFVAGKLVHGEFKIDPLAKPKTIDIIFTEGPGKGHSQKGIYELEGDTQKICIAMPDQPRPPDFVTSPENEHIIEILKREKR